MALLLSPGSARSESSSDSVYFGNVMSASARLDFVITIGKFLFFRVGTGSYPHTNSTIDTVSATLTPQVPPTGAISTPGNAQSVAWSGAAPTFVSPAPVSLPVEVQSNTGPIRITAGVTGPLSSLEGQTIPLSSVQITSSNPTDFPAPPVPNTGTGTSVQVTGTAFSGLVTNRTASWNFAITPVAAPVAGQYTGRITFTATTP